MPAEANSEISWALPRENDEAKIGTGNWRYFPQERLPTVFVAAEKWKEQIGGIEKPWLCWCIDDEWCWLQQQLVAKCGWTPVVGTDGRVAQPRLIDKAVFVDFNEQLKLPLMWMHFPLEFAHLFANRLAYWHSDVLPPANVMKRVAAQFESAQNGEIVGVRLGKPNLVLLFKRYLRGKPVFYKRWWEVIGCTTAGASQSQYQHGCGWWRNPQNHPNASLEVAKSNPFKEHGVGIYLWQSLFGGRAIELCVDIQPYHYSTNQPGYRRERDSSGKIVNSKHWELSESFDLDKIAQELGLE